MAGEGRRRSRTKFQREFVSEAEEILERMREGLADLSEAGADAAPELVNAVFRGAHSLKGLSGMFGLDAMSDLSHRLEDVLDGLRMGRLRFEGTAIDLLEEACGLLSASIDAFGDAEAQGPLAAALAELGGRIESWARQSAPRAENVEAPIDAALLGALTEYEEHRLRECQRRGKRIHGVERSFPLASFEEGLSELTGAIREVGEVLSTLPAAGEAAESRLRFLLLVATDLEPRALATHLDLPAGVVRSLLPDPEVAEEPEPRPAPPRSGSDFESLKSVSGTVRVDIAKLDELMNLVGELGLQRGALGAITARLRGEPATRSLGNELEKVHRSLERKLQDLQAGVLEVRMVPLRQVFEKLSRVVRRLQRASDKSARLQIQGANTELDKLIVEELADPLVHLVRNAFDHALESPGERVAVDKPEHGTIRIEASQRGNDVVIAVSDDGRGIDAEAVHRRAIALGMVDEAESLSVREKLDLICAPGFTTRDEVTDTSGRGVGMDVVRSNVTRLGGSVRLESTQGRGTTVTLTLPITLAIIQALIVGVGDQSFAIPLHSVRETLLISPQAIQRSHGRELLNLRGEALPLRRLARDFELPENAEVSRHPAVVVGVGDARMGLLVDRLEGQQDAVIKSIQGPVGSVPGIAGATELGNGAAVLVLDAAAFVEDGNRRREAA